MLPFFENMPVHVQSTDIALYRRKYPVYKLPFSSPISLNFGQYVQPVLAEKEVLLVNLPTGNIHKCEIRDFDMTYRPILGKNHMFEKVSFVIARQLDIAMLHLSYNGTFQEGAEKDYFLCNFLGQRTYIVAQKPFEELYEHGDSHTCIMEQLRQAIDLNEASTNKKHYINADVLYPPDLLSRQPLYHKTVATHTVMLEIDLYLHDRHVRAGETVLWNENGGNLYHCPQSFLKKYYRPSAKGAYFHQKITRIKAVQIRSPFRQVEKNGCVKYGKAGDYLACQEHDYADRYIIPYDMFEVYHISDV